MKLLQLTIATAQEAEEALTEYLTNELLAQGVEVRRRSDFIAVPNRSHGETIDLASVAALPEDIEVTGYFNATEDAHKLQLLVQAKLAELASYGLQTGTSNYATGGCRHGLERELETILSRGARDQKPHDCT
ncbi:hypothetical protein [Amylolactobacillus amylophilus]|uniref:hypothetical protein n=1 Tax=Amylolactobacillus amylophilus TaxID=1603 RepID=UPI000A9C9116|nr:hypothetical protein [Amylolactobacillus amylophilus]